MTGLPPKPPVHTRAISLPDLEERKDDITVFVGELLKTWQEINDNPAIIGELREQYGLLPDLPAEAAAEAVPYFEEAVASGVYPLDGGKPEDVAKIANDLGVSEEEVVSMNRRMCMGGDTSLNAPLRNSEDGEGQWQDFLVSEAPLQDEIYADEEERTVRRELLASAMESLNDREKHILVERRLSEEPKTLEDLSQVYGVSRERIRQIEVRAFEKLQAALIRLAGEQRLLPAA